mmetsp:Transcript_36216/g.113632  ORF Transcript_36216/g.113632 Transcript_36216/m.113632 type:complete len:222 (+) Transcript_36216:458-1123(+)
MDQPRLLRGHAEPPGRALRHPRPGLRGPRRGPGSDPRARAPVHEGDGGDRARRGLRARGLPGPALRRAPPGEELPAGLRARAARGLGPALHHLRAQRELGHRGAGLRRRRRGGAALRRCRGRAPAHALLRAHPAAALREHEHHHRAPGARGAGAHGEPARAVRAALARGALAHPEPAGARSRVPRPLPHGVGAARRAREPRGLPAVPHRARELEGGHAPAA